jgi:hypothetical protein
MIMTQDDDDDDDTTSDLFSVDLDLSRKISLFLQVHSSLLVRISTFREAQDCSDVTAR